MDVKPRFLPRVLPAAVSPLLALRLELAISALSLLLGALVILRAFR
jgi:hypothetical protein